jgi:hypothetical protein
MIRGAVTAVPAWLRTAAAVALLVAAISAASFRTWNNRVVLGDLSAPGYGFVDFRDGVYFPTLSFVVGENPLDAKTYVEKYPVSDRAPLYSPLMYLMHAPLTALPFEPAAVVYFAILIVLTIALAALVLDFAGIALTTARVATLAALVIMSRPGLVNLFSTQVTLQAVLATYLAFWHAATRPTLSAVALAISTFKGTYGLPVALLMAARDDRRAVALGVAVAVLLTAPAVVRIAVGVGGVAPIVESARDTLSTRLTIPWKQPQFSHFRIDAVATAARTLGRSPTTPETVVLMAVILGASAAAMRRLRPYEDRARRLHATSIGALAVVAAFYHQSYDGLALLLPLVVLVIRADLEPWRSHPGWRWATLALVAVPFVNFLATDSAAHRFGRWALLAASSANGFAILGAGAAILRLAWRVP